MLTQRDLVRLLPLGRGTCVVEATHPNIVCNEKPMGTLNAWRKMQDLVDRLNDGGSRHQIRSFLYPVVSMSLCRNHAMVCRPRTAAVRDCWFNFLAQMPGNEWLLDTQGRNRAEFERDAAENFVDATHQVQPAVTIASPQNTSPNMAIANRAPDLSREPEPQQRPLERSRRASGSELTYGKHIEHHDCAICLEKESIFFCRQCGNRVHLACAQRWAEEKEGCYTCPLCREQQEI